MFKLAMNNKWGLFADLHIEGHDTEHHARRLFNVCRFWCCSHLMFVSAGALFYDVSCSARAAGGMPAPAVTNKMVKLLQGFPKKHRQPKPKSVEDESWQMLANSCRSDPCRSGGRDPRCLQCAVE